jgi:hypothetical protein
MSNFEIFRSTTPYGIWRCADGREVLFNRKYQPIWERLPDGTVRAADPGEWVPFVDQRWFFKDDTSPVSYWNVPKPARLRSLDRINAVLREWGGIAQIAYPRGGRRA